MSCQYKAVCPFQRKKDQLDKERFARDNAAYCEGKCQDCAIFKVISATSFLKVPTDLMPDQVSRVSSILSKDFTNIRI